MTIENLFTVVSLSLALTGGIFAFIQWNAATKTRRTEFLGEIINKLVLDKDMAKAMYTIEYDGDDRRWYTEDFHGSELELQIDKLFTYINFILYLLNTKRISDKEFDVIKYEIYSICVSLDVQTYLWNLYHSSKEADFICPFMRIIDYGINNNLIAAEFKTNAIDLFEKQTNSDPL